MDGKMLMHGRARGIGINLHKQLTDHFSAQTFTDSRQLTGGIRRASLAGEADLGTNLGDMVVHRRVHVGAIMP